MAANTPAGATERAARELFERAQTALLTPAGKGERIYVSPLRSLRYQVTAPIGRINTQTGEQFRPEPKFAQFEDGMFRTSDKDIIAKLEGSHWYGNLIVQAEDVLKRTAEAQVARLNAIIEDIPEPFREGVLTSLQESLGKAVHELPPKGNGGKGKKSAEEAE